jgi:hypothetical protein
VFGGPFYLLWHNKLEGINFQMPMQQRITNLLVWLAIFIPGIILHELIHGIFFVIYSKNKWKSIKFGFVLKKGVAYCTCLEPIKIKHFIVAGIMPGILLGILPAIISEIIGNLPLLFIGIVFTMGAIGDLYIIFSRLIHENGEDYAVYKLEGEDMPIPYIYRRRNKNGGGK